MKRFVFIAFVLCLLCKISEGQNTVESSIKINAETGEVVSGLPTSLAPGDELNFQLYFDPVYKSKEVVKLLEHHMTAYKKVGELIETNNKGLLILRDRNGNIRDYVTYDKSGYNSNMASFTRLPHKKGFHIHPIVDKKRFSVGKQAIPESVFISEVIIDPASALISAAGGSSIDASDQMVEVLNAGTSSVDIAGWTILVNGTVRHKFGAHTSLNPSEALSSSKDFNFPKHTSSIKITLEDTKQNVIDSIRIQLPIQNSYKEKKSITRRLKNGKVVFTKNSSSEKTFKEWSKDAVDDLNLSGHLMPSDVLINEIFTNPNIDTNGDGKQDDNDRFIELANYSTETVDLSGWTLYNGSVLLHTFGANYSLNPGGISTVFGGGAKSGFINANPSGLTFDQSLFSSTDLNDLRKRIKEQVNCMLDPNPATNKYRFNKLGVATEWIFDWPKYDRKRDELLFPNKGCVAYVNSQVPNFDTRLIRKFELRIIYYDAKGQIIHEQIPDVLEVDLLSLPNPRIDNGTSNAFLKPFSKIKICDFGATHIAYELRLINPYLEYINTRDDPAVRVESFAFNAKKPLDAIKKKYAEITSARGINSFSDYDIEQFKSASSRELAIYKLSTHANATFNSWLVKWLWFNKGELKLNPFNTSDLQLKLSPLDAEIKKIQTRITASSGIYNLQMTSTNKDDFHLFNDPIALEKKKREQGILKGKINEITSLQVRDELLYRGKLMLSPSSKNVSWLMRHHDAKNKYVSWPERDTKEITENQNLSVLIENTKPSTSVDITLSAVAIESEETGFQEEAVGEQLVNILKLDNIPKMQSFFKADFSYSLPISSIRDTSPLLQTTTLSYERPVTAPANVSYTVNAGVAGKEKEVVKSNFRNNKLYGVRLKSGLLYSSLKLQSIDSTGANPTISDQAFGVDGTFGFQVYWKKTDIRKLGNQFRGKRPSAGFFYLGFSMKKLQENLYLGFGIEPASGVSLLTGVHVGERDRIIKSTGGELSIVGREWRTGIFGAILIDINVLTNLFGLSGTIPFN